MNSIGGRLTSVAIGVATAVAIVALAIVPFLSPQWVAFEQGRSQAEAWTGYTTVELQTATNAILSDLVSGPPNFDVQVRGVPVLEPREQAHMRDVRQVFLGLWFAAAVSVSILLVAGRRLRDRARLWRAIGRGAKVLIVVIVALGVVALVAFDTLFEVFHEVLFPAGSYDFDPATERLVQLFPFDFWQETAIVVGAVIIGLAVIVAIVAARRLRAAVPNQAIEPAETATAPG